MDYNNPLLTLVIILSNILIAISYFAIPIAIMYLAGRRSDLFHNWIFRLFSIFILLCGLTHIAHISSYWYQSEAVQVIIVLLTAIVSFVTAIVLWLLVPKILRFPRVDEIRRKNKMLLEEITKRKEAEEEIRALNRTLEGRVEERTSELEFYTKQMAALYNSPVIGVVRSNFEGVITNANQAFLDMIGYKKSDLEKKRITWEKITPKKYSKAQQKTMNELSEKGVVNPYGREYIRKDGGVVYVILGGTLVNSKTKESISFAVDISERKKLEIRKDEFMGIASHELKTPLTSIKGYIQILERRLENGQDEKSLDLIEKANVYIGRLDKLITDLLNVSRIQSGKLVFDREVFDVFEFAQDSVDAMQQTTESHTIHLIENTHAFVFADKNRIEQVLSNLLSNAIKYSPESTRIDVRVTKDDRFVTFAIRDFGIGISEKKIKHLFERFYRVEETAKQFSGMGVGLYISQEIVRRHKGKMWVESTEKKGSTFYFSLPHAHKSGKLQT